MPSNHLILCCPLFLLPSIFPESGSFLTSQFFTLGGQSIGVSASASVLPMKIQDWFPLGWTGWISLESNRLSRVFSNTTVQKHPFFGTQLFFIVQFSHPCMTIGKTIALTIRTFFSKVIASYSLYNCKQLVLLMNWHESWKTGDSVFSDLLAKMLISQRHWLIKCVIFHWLLTNVCLLLLITSRSKGKEIIGRDSTSLVLLVQIPFLGRMFWKKKLAVI